MQIKKKFRNERGGVITDTTKTQRIRDHYQQLNANRQGNPEGKATFLETCSLPRGNGKPTQTNHE